MSSDPRPLAGLRVLSFGTFVAGNVCAAILANLGADVVKIESPHRPEPLRSYYTPDHGETFEPSGMRTTATFASLTAGLRSAGLHMDAESGRELFRRLAAQADVVVENFGPGQLERWGCGFETLRNLRPDLVMASLSGYGQTGPRAHYRAYASNIANYLGLRSAWAHDGMHFDFVAAFHAVVGILAARESVRRGGGAVHLDIAQTETGAALMAPLYLAELNGDPAWNQGPNQVPGAVLSGVFACSGHDAWVAVEIEDADDVETACRLLEIAERDNADLPGRLKSALAGWCAAQTPVQAAWRLQTAGLAASAVQNLEDLWRDPQLRSRNAYAPVDHPDLGPLELPAAPELIALGLPRAARPGARLGGDTARALRDWLGVTPEELRQLELSGACWLPQQAEAEAGPRSATSAALAGT